MSFSFHIRPYLLLLLLGMMVNAPAGGREHPAEKSLPIPVPIQPAPAFTAADITAAILLPQPDRQKIMEEDARGGEDPEKGLQRIGVFQPLPQAIFAQNGTLSHGVWRPHGKTGAVWAMRIIAPNALGQRIEIEELALPSGAELWLYNEDRTEEVYGPFNAIPKGGISLWTPACYGQSVVLVCVADDVQKLSGLTFRIHRIGYIYKSILTAAMEKAGACNLDSTCYPAWAEAVLGVGGLGIIGSTGVLFCTCSLLADAQECTETPYVLTAHHCVGAQTGIRGADTLEFYWLYQTPVCNGTAPSPASVPRTTGGADYLAGMGGRGDSGGGNDFTFLRMRNMPPGGLTYLGWTTTVPALGTPVVGLHHPRGSFTRISFGDITNTANPYSPYYHEVIWHDGVTEPGSSGSCLMIEAAQQIIGQLWGGDSACDTPTLPDYYGRFDVTFPRISSWLEPGPAQVGFSAAEYTVGEGDGTGSITVVLSNPSRGDISVHYETSPGTAIADVDFTPTSGTLFYPRGATTASFLVSVLPNPKIEPGKTVYLSLTNSNCPELGLASAILTILDDDVDSDGDGLSDEEEIAGIYGFDTDPHKADTDGDGLKDGEEVFGTHGVQTNPALKDSDYDGVDDFTEIHYGRNPMDPSDTPRIPSMIMPLFH